MLLRLISSQRLITLLKRSSSKSGSDISKPDGVEPKCKKELEMVKPTDKPQSGVIPCVRECSLLPQPKFPTYTPLDKINVTILNALQPENSILSSLLKCCPLINEIKLYDDHKLIRGYGMDIAQINTACNVLTFTGDHQLRQALCRTDVVLISASGKPSDVPNSGKVFRKNAERVKYFADVCMTQCPEAIFVISAYPVTSTVPLFAETFLNHGILCPNKVIGSAALQEMRARTVAATMLGMDPAKMRVNIIGGVTPQTAVPVLSGAIPGGKYLTPDYKKLYRKLSNMTRDILKMKEKSPSHSVAFGLFHLISSIAKGLCGKKHDPASVFIRTSALYGVKYLTVPVTFGLAGIEKNLGVPILSPLEVEALDLSLAELQEDIARGEKYAKLKPVNEKTELYDLEDQEEQVVSVCPSSCA